MNQELKQSAVFPVYSPFLLHSELFQLTDLILDALVLARCISIRIYYNLFFSLLKAVHTAFLLATLPSQEPCLGMSRWECMTGP